MDMRGKLQTRKRRVDGNPQSNLLRSDQSLPDRCIVAHLRDGYIFKGEWTDSMPNKVNTLCVNNEILEVVANIIAQVNLLKEQLIQFWNY